MMKIVSSHFFAVAVVAALSFNLCHPFTEGRELYFENFEEVACLPESPEVCVGMWNYATPTYGFVYDEQGKCILSDEPSDYPGDNCEYIMIGGYFFEYNFVEGLEEGSTTDYQEIMDAKTGLKIYVDIRDDMSTCEITVVTESGIETCTMCSTANCGNVYGAAPSLQAIEYDCTNLENGKSSTSECESSLQPIFYPFVLDGTSPTESPQEQCVDNTDFRLNGKKRKNCEWVGKGKNKKQIRKRCKKTQDGTKVWDWCPEACAKAGKGPCA